MKNKKMSYYRIISAIVSIFLLASLCGSAVFAADISAASSTVHLYGEVLDVFSVVTITLCFIALLLIGFVIFSLVMALKGIDAEKHQKSNRSNDTSDFGEVPDESMDYLIQQNTLETHRRANQVAIDMQQQAHQTAMDMHWQAHQTAIDMQDQAHQTAMDMHHQVVDTAMMHQMDFPSNPCNMGF